MQGLVVDLFIANPRNATSVCSATELVISRLAFLGVVAKFVKIGNTFECGVWRSIFPVIPNDTIGWGQHRHFIFSVWPFIGPNAKLEQIKNRVEHRF